MHSRGSAHALFEEGWLEFGRFRLDPEQKILWCDDRVLPLGPKVVHTLFILATNPGQVISRERLIREVWSDTAVEDSNLAHNIFVLRKSLKEDPSGAFTIETVPRRGYRFCDASAAKPVPSPHVEVSRPKRAIAIAPPSLPVASNRRLLTLVLGLGVLTCLGAVAIHRSRTHGSEKSLGRHAVAVVGLANLSQHPDSAWLSPALSEMLTTELGAGGRLLTIPDESVARARTELGLDNRDGFSSETLGRLRRNLNADLVVSGAYTVLPKAILPGGSPPIDNQLRLDLRVQNAATGETVDAISEIGEESSLFELVARAGTRVRQDLGVETIAPEDAEQARSSVSSNPRAVRLYAEGMEHLRSFDALAARNLLQQAVDIDPDYALAHSALAEVWMMLGYDERATQAAETAYRLSGKLGLEQKLLIEGQYHEAAHQWNEAIAAYRTLFNAFPDNIEYGLRLVRAQRLAAQYRDARATLQALRKLPTDSSSDPRIDLEESMAAASSGDDAGGQRAAATAEKKGQERGSSLLIAQAKLVMPISSSAAFVAQQQDAQHICQRLGNMDCVGQTWLRIGRSQVLHPESKTDVEQALAIFARVGDERRVAEAQNALGVLQMDQGNFADARREYSEARATCEKIGDRSCVTQEILNDGDIDSENGEVHAAEREYRKALVLARQTGEDQLIWGSLNNIASVLADYEGNLAEAETIDRELVETDRKSGKEARMIFTLSNLGAVLAEEGHLAEARRILMEVEQRSINSGGRAEYGSSAVTLAEIDVAEGHPSAAEARLRPMAKFLEDEHHNFAAVYYDGIASAQLAQRRPSEAQRTAVHARELLRDAHEGFENYHLQITAARVAAAAQPQDAQVQAKSLASLRQVVAQCRKSGFMVLQFHARLAESQVEMQSGAMAAGQAHLAALEHEASSRGFGLIARQASTIRQVSVAEEAR